MDGWHGDENEIEQDARQNCYDYEDEHADDWKYEFNNED